MRGALAHGGLGWIYLAVDRNVDDRWVVLKGVLDANDPAALAAARAERQFLAQLSHPNIVAIHNFVRHVENDDMGREHTADYIVMAYIGGSTLAQVRDARADQGVLPVAHALTYMIKVLPALGYLHAEGHVYSDFKPDNVMQCERHLTLIDMGAVARIDDADAVVYGTVGYHAPEVVRAELSPASDLYTVGRTLAVLALGIEPARGGVETELPDDHPLLLRHESLHRLLLRATHPDPLYRFGSADEMAEQLDGVRREVLAVDEQRPRPAPSAVFSAPRGTFAPGLLLPDAESGPGRPAAALIAGRLPEPLDAGQAGTRTMQAPTTGATAGPRRSRRWPPATSTPPAPPSTPSTRRSRASSHRSSHSPPSPSARRTTTVRSATTSWSRPSTRAGPTRRSGSPAPCCAPGGGPTRSPRSSPCRPVPAATSPPGARRSRPPCSATTPDRPTTTSCARPRRCWSSSTWTR